MKNQFSELEKLRQSVWLDNISRDIINNGELKNLIDDVNLKGVTSNPSIFQKAMEKGTAYDAQISELLKQNPGITAEQLFEELAIKDIQDAADILLPVFKKTNGNDGFISIEVSPILAFNTEGSINEARRLHKKVGRPNLMVKIPGTKEGIPAIRKMIAEGVNINITLIFSQAVYEAVAEAYLSALEERVSKGLPIENIASVASFFVSRIDSMVDKELNEKGHKELLGKAAIANAKLAYVIYKRLFFSERFKKLQQHGAKVQRLLWASTSTKNPDYPDTLYIDELIGIDTINTMPPATIKAFGDHGKVKNALEENVDEASKVMDQLKKAGVDFNQVTDKLTVQGVRLFSESYHELLNGIQRKMDTFSLRQDTQKFYAEDNLLLAVKKRIEYWKTHNVANKVWQHDPTVWKEKPEDNVELSNRLGWLELPSVMKNHIQELNAFSDEIRKEFNYVVLLGMGGSSLAPEVFFKTFGKKEGYPALMVLDSTHPLSVKKVLDTVDLEKTVFIVASKSGGTTETMSFYYEFDSELKKRNLEPGRHFIAISDPGSSLQKLAKEKNFRKVFTTPEEVGGRYSALTYFGLAAASLIGVDLEKFLTPALQMQKECSKDSDLEMCGGFALGAFLGECAIRGKDKLIFITSHQVSSFPVWIEQLIAESTGKEGKGILPVEGDDLSDISGDDRVYAHITLQGEDQKLLNKVEELKKAGYPLVEIKMNDIYDLAKEMYRWEIATAMAGSVMNINPFNQPNVQLAKTMATETMAEFSKTGKLPKNNPVLSTDGISAYGSNNGKDIKEFLSNFFAEKKQGAYAAIMAFLPQTEEMESVLNKLRDKIKAKYHIPVTVGFGPRFLHSTGQLHKGDGNNGLFIQFTGDITEDMEVPGKGYTFGTLVTAQAMGDKKALENNKRNVISFNLSGSHKEKIEKITSLI